MTEHSPTPWIAITNDSGKTQNEIYEVRDANAEIVCYVPFPSKEIAKRVVKAVNSYPDLIGMLKLIDMRGGLGIDIHERIREVIAKAEGE